MVKYKDYTTAQYETWLGKSFAYNYGISEEKMATHFVNSGTYVVRQYGITKQQMLDTYIPELKKGLGGYVFFLMYTITENGGAGNWINHYASDTSSTGLGCMKDDIKYLKGLNKDAYPVAKSAPEVLGGANFVEDKRGEVDKFYNSLSNKSIGVLFMPSTLAGNAWVWATNWCLQNQGASAPSVYFGNPYDQIIKSIKNLGGDPFGDGGGASDDQDNDDTSSGGSSNSGSSMFDILKKAFSDFLGKIQDAMTWDVHSVGSDKYFSNTMFSLEKTFNNTYRLHMNAPLLKEMDDLLNSIDTSSNGSDNGGSAPNDDDDDTGGSTGGGKSVKPNGKNATQVGQTWTYDTLPTKYKEVLKENGIPKFDPKYLNGSPFVQFGQDGQCTELTWAYMHQLWGKEQPAWDDQVTNGQRVWEVYKQKGAKTTHSPTVKYGFSSKPPYINAALVGVGHTGIVVAVFDDGSFLTANYNIAPYWANSRIVEYALINGVPENAGTNIMFFSGIA